MSCLHENMIGMWLQRLRKIRRAHGACVVFFLKSIKVCLLQLLIKQQENKKLFFNLSFISSSYYYYNTIKHSTLCSTLTIFYNYLLLLSLTIFFQKYTKSFGGKIWANLHSISPDNIFETKICKTCL